MLKKWDVTIPSLTGDKPRRAYVYLPEYYDDDPNRRFPVMYMFDGQNIFLDEDASYGKSWGMYNFMQWTRKPLIIVAVECNRFGERFNEYAPVTYENREHGFIKGKGRLYMNWLVGELKPYIDANYRTLTDRKNTIIAGSSMGGLMSLYAATVYNHVFSKAACLSPSLWTNPEKLLKLVEKAKLGENTTIYMDYGSQEMGNHSANKEALMAMSQLLLEKNVNLAFRIIPGGTHSEGSWEKQIPIFMDCLGL